MVRRPDLGALEVEHAVADDAGALERHRRGDEALHEEAIGGLHVRLERGDAGGAEPVALGEHRPLRGEVHRVDRRAAEGRERARPLAGGARGDASRHEHDGLLPREARADRALFGAGPEDDLDAVVAIAPLPGEEEGGAGALRRLHSTGVGT